MMQIYYNLSYFVLALKERVKGFLISDYAIAGIQNTYKSLFYNFYEKLMVMLVYEKKISCSSQQLTGGVKPSGWELNTKQIQTPK